MKKPRIYIDTSVIGGCFDEEFELWSSGLVADFKAGLFKEARPCTNSSESRPSK